MQKDLWSLYEWMYTSRLFEGAVTELWEEGLISGEMHLGTGEEAIAAGVTAHLQEGDAVALDHRSTPVLLMRGVDPARILLEMLGSPGGLSAGMGGHMHMFSRKDLMASTGIVGAGGPAAAGFALAAQALRPRTLSVAFFGEGAVNQGMMMESLHLASLWKLPVLFVCKDDGWQITTQSGGLAGSDLLARAEALGVPGMDVDGLDVLAVWDAASEAIRQVRAGGGPRFLHAGCVHLEGHFLGFQLLKALRDPLRETLKIGGPLVRSMLQPGGAGLAERLAGLRTITGAMASTGRDPREEAAKDPLTRARAALVSEPERLKELEGRVEEGLQHTLTAALMEVQP